MMILCHAPHCYIMMTLSPENSEEISIFVFSYRGTCEKRIIIMENVTGHSNGCENQLGMRSSTQTS